MRRILLVVSAWLMLAAAPTAALAAQAPTPATPLPGPTACGEPRALIDSGHPRRALDWLDDRAAAKPTCPGLRGAAAAAKKAALERFTYALALAGEAEGDPDLWPTVQALLPQIAAVDADVARDGTSLDDLEATVEEGIAQAREILSEEDVDASSDGWAGLADGYLKNLGVILAAATGTALLLLALSRLAVTIPYRFANRRRSSRASRRVAEVVGVGLLVAASLAVALVLPDAIEERSVSWGPVILAGALCLGAVVALAYVLSTRLRVSIAVSGETENAGTTEIVALLRELGGSAPQGLEVPRGADITALEGKNILTESTGGWWAAIIRVVQQVMGFTPWRVVVDHKMDPDGKVAVETFVVVTRNGRSVDAATMRRQPFGPNGPTVDTSKVAAAFVLKAIADGYNERDFRGLAGAREWASIGLQYVATTDKSLSAEHRKQLLTHAVDLDPSNLLAQVSLKHEQYRHVTSHPDLHTYLVWLTRLISRDTADNPLACHADLDLRVHYTALAVALNHRAASTTCPDPGKPEARERLMTLTELADAVQRRTEPDARKGVARLLRRVPAIRRFQDRGLASEKLRERVRVAAEPMLAQARGEAPTAFEQRTDHSPTTEYNLVCWQVSASGAATTEHVERLKRILASDDDIAWAKKDPTLAPLRALPTWLDDYGAKRRSFLDVAPFSAHADALTKLGLDTPATLAKSSLSSFEIARAEGIGWATYRRLRDAAVLVAAMDGDLEPHRVEIFAALWGMGLGNRRTLRKSRLPLASILGEVLTVLEKLPTAVPDRAVLETWIERQASSSSASAT